eukprot:928370-Rhodomonas_salina.1
MAQCKQHAPAVINVMLIRICHETPRALSTELESLVYAGSAPPHTRSVPPHTRSVPPHTRSAPPHTRSVPLHTRAQSVHASAVPHARSVRAGSVPLDARAQYTRAQYTLAPYTLHTTSSVHAGSVHASSVHAWRRTLI